MNKVRVIPVLLLRDWGIEKSIRFRDHVYVGSPINAARVFNAANVDELFLLDIAATPANRGPKLEVVEQIADETRMPFTVGGGIRSLDTIRDLLRAGADRVSINSYALEDPAFIHRAAEEFGSQCIVVSMDVRQGRWGKTQVCSQGGRKKSGRDPVAWAQEAVKQGAGELLVNAIDRDGTMDGYDIEMTRAVADAVPIPVIACGGAGSVEHMRAVVDDGHASAVAAGAFFLFYGARRTVLISYPEDEALMAAFGPERIRRKDARIRPPERGQGT